MKLVTCGSHLVSKVSKRNIGTNAPACLFYLPSLVPKLTPIVRLRRVNLPSNIPRACRIPSVDALPSTRTSLVNYLTNPQLEFTRHAPSMTTLILLNSPWTTSSVWATVSRASSWVSRSSLCRTASMSLSPSNFLANFSAQHSTREELMRGSHLLNRPWLICFVARASTESTSTIILTMISDMAEDNEIFSV